MKKSWLIIFFISCLCNICFAQDSLLHNKVDANSKTLNEMKAKLDAVGTAVDSVKQTLGKDTFRYVDASALDSARRFPLKVLYSTYLFNKDYKANMQWFFAILAFALLLFMLIASFYYAKTNSLIKDIAFDANGNRVDPRKSPYSYSRVQLLWWTLIILSCYIYFFGITGVLLPLNATAALLLGLGAVVHGMGRIIDNRQIAAAKGSRTQDEDAQRRDPDFLTDILSDENGISIHRFQSMIFNIVFGIGFVAYFVKSIVDKTYPFPDFNEWQFALIGISSATYLGMKSSENAQAIAKQKRINEQFAGNNQFPADFPDSAIEFHQEDKISQTPPTTPPPNIK